MKLQRQIDQLLALRASEWHQILENASESERSEFVAWLKQSPLHVKEYLEVVYMDQVLKHADEEKQQDIDALLADIVPAVVPLSKARVEPTPSQPLRKWWKAGLVAGLAAGIVVCAVSIPLIYERHQAPAFSTNIGEQRTIQLADASIVTLNVDSRISVRLDETRRDVELLRGEALFKVAHDAKRPFTVRADDTVIQAVGTQFNVYERPEGTRVSVLEGKVKVSTPRKTQLLSANEEAQVLTDGTIQLKTNADVLRTVAWRERRLVFADTPLEEMVHEFNRYSGSVRLRLESVPPGTHHYNGIFDAADPESLATLLSKEPDLLLDRRGREIVIRAR